MRIRADRINGYDRWLVVRWCVPDGEAHLTEAYRTRAEARRMARDGYARGVLVKPVWRHLVRDRRKVEIIDE